MTCFIITESSACRVCTNQTDLIFDHLVNFMQPETHSSTSLLRLHDNVLELVLKPSVLQAIPRRRTLCPSPPMPPRCPHRTSGGLPLSRPRVTTDPSIASVSPQKAVRLSCADTVDAGEGQSILHAPDMNNPHRSPSLMRASRNCEKYIHTTKCESWQ